MSAYLPILGRDLVDQPIDDIVAKINLAQFGVRSQQQEAWYEQARILQEAILSLATLGVPAMDWTYLFEYQQLRIKRRIDLVVVADDLILCVEFKVRATRYESADRRQTEDYALDLRDFHEASHNVPIIPLLCATDAGESVVQVSGREQVLPISLTNEKELAQTIRELWVTLHDESRSRIDPTSWNDASYQPVPTVIQAAESIFGAHTNMDINTFLTHIEDLNQTSQKVLEVIADAQRHNKHVICFVTGVPGSGKTLVGLRTVHDPTIRENLEGSGAYLSGNSPLVAVLREALARDKKEREGVTKKSALDNTKAAIQHIMDFLREYLDRDKTNPPHEHVIVFDEAQRAWDAKYGKQKFNREASEPELILSIMSRHTDWAVVVALVGGGQEINRGEGGLGLWGQAVKRANEHPGATWEVVASNAVFEGAAATVGSTLFASGDQPAGLRVDKDSSLHLPVSVRSHRSEKTNEWIECVLSGDRLGAARKMRELAGHQIYLTRSLDDMKKWLRAQARGFRRSGLVASSGARRLRAYGLGLSVGATDLDETVHWFLAPHDDVRSSNMLEVTANEYGCQGLEVDHVGLCWGGDLTWSDSGGWVYRRFSGSRWQAIRNEDIQENLVNKYRVLLSRARESLVVWVPPGDPEDETREPSRMDATARFLLRCGVAALPKEFDSDYLDREA